MEININNQQKTVDIWLTKSEAVDSAVHRSLQSIYNQFKCQKYTVAVFRSGQQDLYQTTLDLLTYNRRRSAELAVQQETFPAE